MPSVPPDAVAALDKSEPMLLVEVAMRTVPREAFVPGTPLADTYGRSPIVTHRDVHGVERARRWWFPDKHIQRGSRPEHLRQLPQHIRP